MQGNHRPEESTKHTVGQHVTSFTLSKASNAASTSLGFAGTFDANSWSMRSTSPSYRLGDGSTSFDYSYLLGWHGKVILFVLGSDPSSPWLMLSDTVSERLSPWLDSLFRYSETKPFWRNGELLRAKIKANKLVAGAGPFYVS